MSMRSDCFANRLTLAQREKLFSDIQGGMTLSEAAKKVRQWSRPKRDDTPSRQAVSGWYRQMKKFLTARQIGRPAGGCAEFGVSGLEFGVRRAGSKGKRSGQPGSKTKGRKDQETRGPVDADGEADEEIERGLRGADEAGVARHGFEPPAGGVVGRRDRPEVESST